MTKSQNALMMFKNNFNCSQAVLTAFADDCGIDKQLALKIATNFGGGARNAEICGAVSGALIVLGLKFGHCDAEDKKEKADAYAISQEYTQLFKQANKSIVCRNLLGYDLTIPYQLDIIKEKKLFIDFCPKMIESAVQILETTISKYEGGNI